MLIILSICSVFIYLFIRHSQQTLNQIIDSKVKSIRAITHVLEEQQSLHYQKRISSLVNYKLEPSREKILQAFANQNRDELLRLSLPYFNLLQSEDPTFATFAWILPDNYNFLRVHNPKLAIDDISTMRPDIVKANRDHQQNSGYMIARAGMRYAIVKPILYKGNHLGALQFGLDEKFLLKHLEEHVHHTFAVRIPNERFSVVTRANLPTLIGKRYALQAHDLTLFEQGKNLIDWGLDQQQVVLQGKEYVIVRALDLLDYSGHSLGQIFAALDISDHVAAAESKILFVLILGSALLLSSFIILYFSYGSLVEHIMILNSSLRQKKEEWENTFDSLSDIVTIQDKHMVIVRANRAAHTFFQEKQERIIGRKCFEIFRGTSTPCPGCPGFDTLQDAHNHAEIVTHDTLGKTFYVSSAPILDETGNIQYLIHTAKDISEQKRMEKELFQSQKMEAIGTLAGGVAHDFNNILSAIIGYSEMARLRLPPDNPAAEDITQVLQASRRAADLVQHILTFSRQSDHCLEPLAPQLLIKEALKMLRASLPSTIEIKEKVDSKCGKIMADPTNIHQIIVNLCTNALHAMEKEKGVLTVKLYRTTITANEIPKEAEVSPGSFIVLEVSDTGHGMDQATAEQIFDPYFTTKEVGKGTGLGLAVVHGIIEDYHGFIRVKSEPGQGASFFVHIPALQEELSPSAETEVNEPLPGGTEHILVVDDESMIANILKAMLEHLGYTVTAMTESPAALDIIRKDPDKFDLIITDQTMPHLTGAELAEKILTIKPAMPIMLCTGYSSILPEEEALAVGIKQYTRKPVDSRTLATKVRLALDG